MVLFGLIVLGWISVFLWLWFDRLMAFRLAGAGGGIGPEVGGGGLVAAYSTRKDSP